MKTAFALAFLLSVAAFEVPGQDWAVQRLDTAMAAYQAGDYAVARQHFRRLAQHGSALAETMLGVMQAEGRGVPENPVIAAAWFYKAATRGYGPAQIALSDAFLAGRGVEKDASLAYFWALAATTGGDRSAEDAGRARAEKIAASLSPAVRLRIEQKLHEWRPRAQRSR